MVLDLGSSTHIRNDRRFAKVVPPWSATPGERRQTRTGRVPLAWPATAGPGHRHTPAADTASRAFRRTGKYAPDPSPVGTASAIDRQKARHLPRSAGAWRS